MQSNNREPFRRKRRVLDTSGKQWHVLLTHCGNDIAKNTQTKVFKRAQTNHVVVDVAVVCVDYCIDVQACCRDKNDNN